MVKRYLSLVTLQDAIDLLIREFGTISRSEHIPLERSAGRTTSKPIFARFSTPPIGLAAMDGIAVSSADTRGASEQHPVTVGKAVRVNTGNVLPAGTDAVVMIEEVWERDGAYVIRKPVSPWQHVRPAGEDIAETEMVLSSRHCIRPADIGALASFGIGHVEVLALRTALVPTGSEVIPLGTAPAPGQVVESNMHAAAAWLSGMGSAVMHYPIVPDDFGKIQDAIRRAVAENDLVLISAGSSAGTRDFTADAIRELGEVLVHGIAIKPGKPAIIGRIAGKPIIGVPGYPLSAHTVIRELVTPFLVHHGFPPPDYHRVTARIASSLPSEIGLEEFVLLAAGKIGGRWIGIPLSRGAGVQMSAVRANGYLRIPAGSEGLSAGEEVQICLTVPERVAEAGILCTGSHDPCLDHIGDLLAMRGIGFHSAHTGSMGGLLALKRGFCHVAPMHLLAPDGTYNLRYLEEHMPGEHVVLTCVAEREQGIVARTGMTLEELPKIRFINRQKGSGTRLLLDHLLREKGIDPRLIPGYEREVTTHLAVALAVKSGEADAGVCVYSAAKALGLSFSPVAKERYEIAVRKEYATDPRITALFETIRGKSFRERLTAMGGYDITGSGEQRTLP
ncbi:MAG: molybdopterin biosynthesis protein [Methanomicrobiales archaeon]|nr:molybdopterin biosynthesis protein [Methanomicrobiales archaeon]